MFKKASLPVRFFLSYLIVIVLVLFIVSPTIFVLQMRTTTVLVDDSLKNMMSVVKSEPGVQQAFTDGKVSGETMRYLDKLISSQDTIDYITLARPDGTRIYHPDHSLIGKHFVGGDEGKAEAGEADYIVDGRGTNADQRRCFHSMKDESGNVTGFIMVSRHSADISHIKEQQALIVIALFVLSVLIAAVIAALIGRRIRRQLLGYEPYEIARMFTQREGILDELEEGLMLVNESGNCEYVNRSAENMIGPDDHENTMQFLGTHVKPLISSGIIISSQTIRFNERTMLMDILPVMDKKHLIGDLVVLRDKTEATKMAAQLTGIDQVIAALRASTHETKNKMHVILGLLQLGESEKAIDYIQSSAGNDAETDTIRQTILNDTLAALLIGKRSRARELGIDFTVRKDSSIPQHSRILSSADLVTIIGNLIENAFDALSGVEDRPREVALVVKEDENGLFISASDTGCGMTEEIIEKIQRESFTTKTEEGHGIGMGLIRNILSGYDSTMEIESEPGEGTMINIMIRSETG